MSDATVKPEAIQQELVELTELFSGFHRMLAEGKHIDMTGMDQRVKEFCDRVEHTDVAIRKTLLPHFSALLVLLEALETELRAVRDRVKQ